jgi:transketolase
VARHGLPARVLNIGVEGGYRFELGTRAELHEQVGIGLQAAAGRIQDFTRSLAARAAGGIVRAALNPV